MVKLLALDEEDLAVLSFYTHNAHFSADEILWQKQQKRFLVPLYRFDWEKATTAVVKSAKENKKATTKKTVKAVAAAEPSAGKAAANRPSGLPEIPAILHFDRVLHVRSYGIDRRQKQQILTLKALCFQITQSPAGIIEFLFHEQTKLQLEVECIEAMLTDLADPL